MDKKIERNASQVMQKLRNKGCTVLFAKRTPRSALINIEQPTTEMQQHAIEIKQTLQGIPSSVFTLLVDGCTVSWSQGEQR
jgi:hypothetical protein